MLMGRRLLIDGDVLAYRYPAAAEYEVFTIKDENGAFQDIRTKTKAYAYLADYPDNPEVRIIHQEKVVEPFKRVRRSIDYAMKNMQDRWETGDYVMFLGGKGNFREEIFPEYKFRRKGKPKPVHYAEARDHLERFYHAEICDGFEADDGLTIAATAEPNSIMCHQDKDLNQMYGSHYNFITGEVSQISRRRGDIFLFEQILAGDSTDDIPGIRGVGEKKAQRLLEGVRSTQEAYRRCLTAYGDEQEMMHLMANLVYLWRYPNDSFEQYVERRHAN